MFFLYSTKSENESQEKNFFKHKSVEYFDIFISKREKPINQNIKKLHYIYISRWVNLRKCTKFKNSLQLRLQRFTNFFSTLQELLKICWQGFANFALFCKLIAIFATCQRCLGQADKFFNDSLTYFMKRFGLFFQKEIKTKCFYYY